MSIRLWSSQGAALPFRWAAPAYPVGAAPSYAASQQRQALRRNSKEVAATLKATFAEAPQLGITYAQR